MAPDPCRAGQYYPGLVLDNHQVEPPKTPEEGYHLTVDLTGKAIEFVADLKQIAPDKPFFMYYATGANPAPHQVPKEWADKYAGQFDDGWDALETPAASTMAFTLSRSNPRRSARRRPVSSTFSRVRCADCIRLLTVVATGTQKHTFN